jgi:hypothetical protein
MQRLPGPDMDLDPEQLLQVLNQPGMIQQTPARLPRFASATEPNPRRLWAPCRAASLTKALTKALEFSAPLLYTTPQ